MIEVAVLTIELYMPWCMSLKDKRSEIKSIIAKTVAKFVVSAVESGLQDNIKSGELVFATLCHNHANGDRVMDSIINYVERNFEAEIVKVDREFR